MEDPDLPLEASRQVYAEQVALLYRNAPLAYAVTVIIGSTLAFVQRAYIPAAQLITWLVCLMLLTAVRSVLAYRYAHTRPDPVDAPRWGRAYVVGAGLAGVAWGSSAIALFPTDAIDHQVLVAFVLAGMTAGGISVLSARMEAALAFMLPILLPLAVQFFRQDGELQAAMSAMTLLFLMGMLIVVRNIHSAICNCLRLDVEKRELLLRLEVDKATTERLNAKLLAEIAERQQAEEQARTLQAEIAHLGRLNVAGEMASGLAHELNQPLAAIATYADTCQMLSRKEPLNTERLRAAAEQIAAQSRRAGEIIRRMRDFTRKTTPHRAPIQLNPLVREMVRFTATEARKREVALCLELAEPLPPVFADAVQIQQVVLNLMRNAMEAMESVPAGRRELRIRTAPAGPEAVEVEVSDTGPGLTPKVAERLFHPFFTTKANGMGLGLSISRSIIEAQDGRLWATVNHPPPGATFHFTLPTAYPMPSEG